MRKQAVKNFGLSKPERNRLQYRAFRAVYKGLPFTLPLVDRFVEAIVATSDEKFETADPKLIKQWTKQGNQKET